MNLLSVVEETRTPEFLRGKSRVPVPLFTGLRFSSTTILSFNCGCMCHILIWFINTVIFTNILDVEIILLTDAAILEQTYYD